MTVLQLADDLKPLADRPAPRVCVVRAGGLGDTILLLPALRRLRAALPAVRITLVGSEWAVALRPLVPFPLEVQRFDAPAFAPLFADGAPALPPALEEADAVVLYTANPHSMFVAHVSRARPSIVWPVHPPVGRHAAAHFADAVGARLDESVARSPSLVAPAPARVWAQGWLQERLGEDAAPVVVHPGSGGRRKCWPPARFAAVLPPERPLVLLEGPADAAAAHDLVRALPREVPVAVAAGESLDRAAALIAEAAVYVGNDSGMSHLAAALGCPSLVVFGPTPPDVWAPLGPRVLVTAPGCGEEWPPVERVRDGLRHLLAPGSP